MVLKMASVSHPKKKLGGGHLESGCNAGYGILIFHSIPELNYFFEKYITHYEER